MDNVRLRLQVDFGVVVSSGRIGRAESGDGFAEFSAKHDLPVQASRWQNGGKGGTRTLDPGIMSSLLRSR
jgi:hypothetical protein